MWYIYLMVGGLSVMVMEGVLLRSQHLIHVNINAFYLWFWEFIRYSKPQHIKNGSTILGNEEDVQE